MAPLHNQHKSLWCTLIICISLIILIGQDLYLHFTTATVTTSHSNALSTNNYSNSSTDPSCDNLLEVLRIQWHNNTNCAWNFVPSNCSLIHKYTLSETPIFLEQLENAHIGLIFFGDSVTRRTGRTLDVYINGRGNFTSFKDAVVKTPLNFHIRHSKQWVVWQTEWAPLTTNVIDILQNKSYIKHGYFTNETINIAVIGIGVWMIKLYPNQTTQWLIEQLPHMVHEYVHWIYTNYFDVSNEIAMQNRMRFHIILRTQTAVGLHKPPSCRKRTRKEINELTKVFNAHLIKYAQLYGIPVFDAFRWSSVEEGYYINSGKSEENVEPYDQLDHEQCRFCGSVATEYRHPCIECADGNCVHMRSNGRMILIQQILNAIHILVHKESLKLE